MDETAVTLCKENDIKIVIFAGQHHARSHGRGRGHTRVAHQRLLTLRDVHGHVCVCLPTSPLRSHRSRSFVTPQQQQQQQHL
jgi:hypothetical protein